MPQYKTATLDEDGFDFSDPLKNLDKPAKLEDEESFNFSPVKPSQTNSSFEQLTAIAVDETQASETLVDDGFDFSSPLETPAGLQDFEFGPTRGQGATSIGLPSGKSTENLDGPQLAPLDDIPYEPSESESQFLNSLDHGLNSVKANYYSLIGEDETATQIMEASNLENKDRGGATGFIGGALLGILPTAVASGLSLVAAPAVATGAAITAMAYYVTTSMGQAQREIYDYEQETGTDVSQSKEILKTFGYGITALVVESLGFGSAKFARAANPKMLIEIGEAFTKKEFSKASKLIVKELPKVAHAAGRAEAGEEVIENTVQNLLSKTYDEHVQIQDGLLTSLAQGYGAGALLGTALRTGAYKSSRALDAAQLEIDTFIDSQAELANIELQRAGRVLYATENKVQTSHIGKPTELQEIDYSPDMKLMKERDIKNNEKDQQKNDDLLYSEQYTSPDVETIVDWENQILELQRLEYNFESDQLLDPIKLPDIDLTSPLFESQNAHEQQLAKMEQIANDLKVEGGNNIILASTPVMMAFRESKLHGVKVIAAKMQQPFKVAGKLISVRQLWGGEIGVAMQNQMSVHSMYQDKGMTPIKQIAEIFVDMDNNIDTRYMVSIVANDPKYMETQTFKSLSINDQAKVNDAAVVMRNYFAESLAIIKEKNLSTKGFYEEQSEKLIEKLGTKISKGERVKILKDLKRMQDLNFVHIPYNLLMAGGHITQGLGLKKMEYMTQRERKTLTIQDIIEPIYSPKGEVIHKGIDTPAAFNFDNVIASYADKLGRDVALAEIFSAGKTDGRIIEITDSNRKEDNYEIGFVKPGSLASKIMKGYQVDVQTATWLNDNTIHQYNPGKFVKVLNAAKHISFLNPIFLGMYDIIQGTYGGSLSYKLLFNGAMKKAWESMKYPPPDMQQALGHGMESSIMAESGRDNIKSAVGYAQNDGTLGGKLRQYYHQYILINADLANANQSDLKKINPFKSIYEVSFNTAWFLDSFIRRTSFYSLRAEGMGIKQAAEEVALIHGKYASVPVKTRRLLNKLLYTPTFKIVMGKYFARMTKDIVKSTKHYDDAGQKGLETAFRLFALMAAQSALMAGLGFEEEEFGRKYTRQVEDVTGKPQQLNITWSAPHNMFFKYIYRFLNTSNDSRTNPLVQFLKANIWELNPVWRVGIQIWGEDRDPSTGKKITKQNVSAGKNQLAQIHAAAKSIFPLYMGGARSFAGPLDDEGTSDLDYVGDGMSPKELSLVSKLTILPYNFLYLSDPTSTKYINRMNALNSQLNALGKDYDIRKVLILSDEDKDLYEKGETATISEQVENILRKVEETGKILTEYQNREDENRNRNY